MNKQLFWALIFYVFIGKPVALASASPEAVKLPYAKGESFVVVQGYDSPPTHIKKDAYAIDFSQNGCDAYGKPAVAASSGKVMLAEESGYNGGYGTQILIQSEGRAVSRYAHLIPGTIPVAAGDVVVRGESLGKIGDTGLVAGAACPTHPGTHIHFAMYDTASAGSFSAHFPEPISGYTNITEGKWYISDNEILQPESFEDSAELAGHPGAVVPESITPIVATSSGVVLGVMTSSESNSPQGSASSDKLAIAGNVSVTLPVSPTPSTLSAVSQSTSADSSTTNTSSSSSSLDFALSTSSATFNSTTLAIDIAWQSLENASDSIVYQIFKIDPVSGSNTVQIGITTSTSFSYPLINMDFDSSSGTSSAEYFAIETTDTAGHQSTLAFASTTIPNWFVAIQPNDNQNSDGSWYSDNWYNLGTGFYGTVRELTLEGFVDSNDYLTSHIWLDEYLDPNYTKLNKTFTISDSAPFTDGLKKLLFADLDLALQPNKYYRLRTFQDHQNRSVILAGTSATGTAMWNEFISGTGRVEHQYSFYPYITAIMIPDYPPLLPPNEPASMTVEFDSLNSIIRFGWPATTDPDTPSSLLTYQINISTSTSLADEGWQSVGDNLSTSYPVKFDNAYLLGIRAVDDLGNVSLPLITSWHFPETYVPIPSQLDHSAQLPGGAQKITFLAPTVLNGIALWTISDINSVYCCSQSFISIHSDDSGTIGAQIATSEPVTIAQRWGAQEEVYHFSSSVALAPGSYWFEPDQGPSGNTGPTYIFGSAGDAYPDGQWSTMPQQDMYFRIEQADSP